MTEFLPIEMVIYELKQIEKEEQAQQQSQQTQQTQQIQEDIDILIELIDRVAPKKSILDISLVTDVPEYLSDEECSRRYQDYLRLTHRGHKSTSSKRVRDCKRAMKGLSPRYPKLQTKMKGKTRTEFHWKIKLCSAYRDRQQKLREQRQARKQRKAQASV